jgi:hypothetical protein
MTKGIVSLRTLYARRVLLLSPHAFVLKGSPSACRHVSNGLAAEARRRRIQNVNCNGHELMSSLTTYCATLLVPLTKGDAVRGSEPQGVVLYHPDPLFERDTPPTS